jgi:DNA-binding transcriptional regulator YhcF (GntR family)
MAIFKKASPLPIQPSAISQGLENFEENTEKPTIRDSDFFIKQLIYELKQNKEHRLAEFCEEMHNQGYGFQQIRDMLSSVRSFLRN